VTLFLQFFEVQPVNNFFRHTHQVLHQEWLRNKILDAVHQRPQPFFDIGRLAMNRKGMCLVASRPRSFSKS